MTAGLFCYLRVCFSDEISPKLIFLTAESILPEGMPPIIFLYPSFNTQLLFVSERCSVAGSIKFQSACRARGEGCVLFCDWPVGEGS